MKEKSIEEKIQEILATNDRQLQVDAIRMIEQGKPPNKEKTFKIIIKQLISKHKKSYPIDNEKKKEEKRKYTESFKIAVKEEQKKIKKEKQEKERLKNQVKIKKMLKSYGLEDDFIENDEKIQEFFKKCQEDQTNTKSFLLQLYEYIMKVREMLNEEKAEQTLPTHKDFMQRMKPSGLQERERIIKIGQNEEREK